MAYEIYFDELLLPIAPAKIDLKVSGNNKSINLIKEGEVSILKTSSLSTIDFEVLLPQVKYPFGSYKGGVFLPAEVYLNQLKKYIEEKQYFRFRVIRTLDSGKRFFETDMKVTLEDYTVKDDVGQGVDILVSISLKEYRLYSTKSKIDEPVRDKKNSPAPEKTPKSYTVVKNDTLWGIAKKYYGSGEKYPVIASANNISNPNFIKIGQVLTIPVL